MFVSYSVIETDIQYYKKNIVRLDEEKIYIEVRNTAAEL